MAFEIVERGKWMPVGMPEGVCSIGRNGEARFHFEDLLKVGIGGDAAVVLADKDTLRIALRAVRDGEEDVAIALRLPGDKETKDRGRRRIGITQAIRRLGLTTEAVAGRYSVNIHNDELLIINVTECLEAPKTKPEPKGKPESKSKPESKGNIPSIDPKRNPPQFEGRPRYEARR